MGSRERNLQHLLEALQHSPENIPLRKHIGLLLMDMERFEEAEKQYEDALRLAPDDTDLKLGLAEAYYELGKESAAMVILEDLLAKDAPEAEALLLHAHLSYESDDPEQALESYQEAIKRDHGLRDPDFEDELAIETGEEDDEFMGRVPVEFPPALDLADIERPEIDFLEVGGFEAVKEALRRRIVYPLEHEEMYDLFQQEAGGGVLLYGPPGTGKTFLARAAAGEFNLPFLAVGLHEILDMWSGNGEKNLHQLFEMARNQAPCLLLLDEFDALGTNRSDRRSNGSRHLINQLLTEMDGIRHDNEGVLILAATSLPWLIDPAFFRPGRFDETFFLAPPDEADRTSLLDIMLEELPVGEIDIKAIARQTEGFSQADLRGLVKRASGYKLRESIEAGKPLPLEHTDLEKALETCEPTIGEWIDLARQQLKKGPWRPAYAPLKAYLDAHP